MRTAKQIILAALSVTVVVCSSSVAARAASELLFNGCSRTVSGVRDALGSVIEIYGTLSSTGGIPTPIPLDPVAYQYTIQVTGMTVTAYGNVPAVIKSVTYAGGELRIYADPRLGGTAADFAAPASFADGELILAAVVDPGWALGLYDFDLNGSFSGSGAGTCDFVSGTRLTDFNAAEYYYNDWNFLGVPVADPNPPYTSVPPGFERIFDVKLTPPNDPSPLEDRTWGAVKAIFR